MDSEHEYVHLERSEHVATVILDRPAAKNAMFPPLSEELRTVVELLEDEPSRVAIIRATEDAGSFCSGGDLDMPPDRFLRNADIIHDVVRTIHTSSIPYIADIEGAALGGGLELALACDVRVASTEALLGVPEVSLGIIPGAGGTRLLPRLIGAARAHELVLTGEPVSGTEAEQIGLVSRAVPPDKLRAEVNNLASTIASNSPAAVAGALASLRTAYDFSYQEGLEVDREIADRLAHSPDFDEGTTAFLEGQEPDFPDR